MFHQQQVMFYRRYAWKTVVDAPSFQRCLKGKAVGESERNVRKKKSPSIYSTHFTTLMLTS